MKKVLIFSLSYYPQFVGGAEVAIKEITDRIDPKEIEFHMVTLRYDSKLPKISKEGNVLVYRIGFSRPRPTLSDLKKFPLFLNKLIFQFSAAVYAGKLHRKYHYDAVWGMMAHSTGVPAGIFKTVHPSVPYILTLQEGDPIDYIKRKMRPLYPLFVRGFTKADIVQAISTFLGLWAKDMGFTGPLEVIPNGVDTKHFSEVYPEEQLLSLKQKLGKNEGDVFLITTSRLYHKNAIDDVIKALKLLPSNVHFLILGTGPDEAKLRQLAQSEGVAEKVKFLGQVAHKDMPPYLQISDIFVRPSRSEGMGNSFIEAMAAGLPIVATQEGGIADLLFDSKQNPGKAPTGFAVHKDSPEEVAEKVNYIISHRDEVKQVISNAKSMAFEKYDWDTVTKKMKEKVFDRVFK